MTDNNGKVRPFGIKDKLGYMFGDFGNDFTFLLSAMFLLKFYTDVMGVSAALVGLMMMAARFVDAITDVTMGQIVDRSRPGKKGKFAPWLRRMCGPVALASFLMYATWFNIPYGSMASAISDNPTDRTSLSNWRTIGATLAQTAIGVVLPLVVYYTDEAGNSVLSGQKMMLGALVCSIGAVICYMLCYKMTTERVKVGQNTQKFSFGELIKELAHNRSLIGIIVCALVFLLAQLSLSNMNAYIYPNYFGNIKAMSIASLSGTIVILLLSTFITKLASKIGKKELSVIGCIISAASFITLFIIHTHNVWIWIALIIIATIGTSMFNMVIWAMITDVIDESEVQNGVRQDGTIYSVYSFARKLGQACSSGLAGVLLSIVGYTTATAFDPKVIDGIYNVTCLMPAAGMTLLLLALIFLYPLNKKRVEANAAKLKEIRAAKEQQ